MYVNPFAFGFVCGICATIVVVLVLAWIAGSKK
jgi:hypothetical protein